MTDPQKNDTPPGHALGMAVLGVKNLEAARDFYQQVIGLTSAGTEVWKGTTFEKHWGLPPGFEARVSLLSAGESPVGRILLMECADADRKEIRPNQERRFIGLFNLNFYVRNIHAAAEALKTAGCDFWSEPVQYDLGEGVGSPIEATVEGPDGILYNLVELAGGDETTRIGQMRAHLDEHGTTPTGFTEVVTTAHCVRSREDALRFYQEILGLAVIIDEIVDKVETNRLLSLPAGSKTHLTFLKGDHPFGKVVTMAALNYDLPDFTAAARPPHIGYLAMGFPVDDLEAVKERCERMKVEVFSPPVEIRLPGIGPGRAMIVKTPGSGALTQLYEI